MATKKQSKRSVVRQVRRALNRSIDFFTKVGGRKLNTHGYGRGVSRHNIRDKDDE